MPTQLQMQGGTPSRMNGTEQVNTGEFGSILASLANSEEMQGQFVGEFVLTAEEVAELLTFTTVEEVLEFLENAGFQQEQLPEVIDGHFIFHEEATEQDLVEVLEAFIPNFEALSTVTEEGSLVIPMRKMLAALEQVAEEFLLKLENDDLQANFRAEDLLLLTAMMQMTVIEGPKVDLTLKQEHQLHALKEVLQAFNYTFNEAYVKEEKSSLPFQVRNHEVKPIHLLVNQSNFSIPTSMGMENVKLESEGMGNSRAEMLIKELQNIFKRANFGQTAGTNRISIKLYPEHLGQLRIELLQTNGLLTARILASNALGKEMLESQLHQLRQAFLQQNIQVERIDISQMLTETPHHERDRGFDQHFKQQEQTNEQTHQEDEEEAMTFSEYMIELEG